jgi:hypothetical protein
MGLKNPPLQDYRSISIKLASLVRPEATPIRRFLINAVGYTSYFVQKVISRSDYFERILRTNP